MKKAEKNIAFEDVFKQLEAIVVQLESGQESIEKSLELFEDGMRLSEICRDKLNVADKKIKELIKTDNESVILKDLS